MKTEADSTADTAILGKHQAYTVCEPIQYPEGSRDHGRKIYTRLNLIWYVFIHLDSQPDVMPILVHHSLKHLGSPTQTPSFYLVSVPVLRVETWCSR